MMDNNRNLQDKLKSLYYHEEVLDKRKSWEALEQRMDKNKKKRFFFWILFGFIVFGSATMTYYTLIPYGKSLAINDRVKFETEVRENTSLVKESNNQIGNAESFKLKNEQAKIQKNQNLVTFNETDNYRAEPSNKKTLRLLDDNTLKLDIQSKDNEDFKNNFSKEKSIDVESKFSPQNLENFTPNSLAKDAVNELDTQNDIAQIGKIQLFIESDQNRYAELNIKPLSKVKFPINISAYALIGKPQSIIEHQFNEESTFTRKNTETALEYFGFGLDAHWFITKNLFFTSGAKYLQINELFEYKNKIIQYKQDDNQVISIYEKSGGETEEVVGSLTTFKSIEINKKKYNSFNQLNMILGLGYELCNFKKFTIRASSGFSIPIYQLYQGEILGLDILPVRLENTLNLKKLNPMIYHEGSFNYRFTNNFTLSLSGMLQYHISSIHKNSNYSSQKFLLYGLKVGPIYNF